MPKTPKGHKRPADIVSNAVRVMKIATGEIDETADAHGVIATVFHVDVSGPEAPTGPTERSMPVGANNQTIRGEK